MGLEAGAEEFPRGGLSLQGNRPRLDTPSFFSKQSVATKHPISLRAAMPTGCETFLSLAISAILNWLLNAAACRSRHFHQ